VTVPSGAVEPTIETLTFTTDDGVVLEGDLVRPEAPWAAVVLAHPHPQMGGDRHSLVTSELFRLLPAEGVATLRFDFRGAGGSEGEHGGGVDEVHDVHAAVAQLAERVPGVPLVVAGWSFGADTSLSVLDERLAGWFALAPPFRFGTEAAGADPRPKLLAIPEHDQFAPPSVAYGEAEDWANTEIQVVPGADHLCAGRTQHVADLLLTFLRALANAAGAADA
jgi:alpha/beta superfamily hydrolase